MDSHQLKILIKLPFLLLAIPVILKIYITLLNFLFERTRLKNFSFPSDRTNKFSFIFEPIDNNRYLIKTPENEVIKPQSFSNSLIGDFASGGRFFISINQSKKLLYIFTLPHEQIPTHIFPLRREVNLKTELSIPLDCLAVKHPVDTQSINIFFIFLISGFLFDHHIIISEDIFYTICERQIVFYFPLTENLRNYILSRLPTILFEKIKNENCFLLNFFSRDIFLLNIYSTEKKTFYFQKERYIPIYNFLDDFFDDNMKELAEYYNKLDFNDCPIIKLPAIDNKFFKIAKFNKFGEFKQM